MLIPLSPVKFRRRPAKPTRNKPAPAMALMLVSASYDTAATPNPTLTLVFNQAIDVSGFAGDTVEVDDGTYAQQMYYALGDWSQPDANSIVVGLYVQAFYDTPGIRMSASDANGIVAVSDGAMWDGVSGLALPYP